MNKRISFSILWSILSFLGIIMTLTSQSFSEPVLLTVYYITGFHIPQNALYFTVLFGLFTDYTEIGLLFFLLFLVFIFFWIVSIFKIKRSRMFEKLICVDRVMSLLIISIVAILQKYEIGWYFFVIPIIENLIIIVLTLKTRKRVTENTGDGSLIDK